MYQFAIGYHLPSTDCDPRTEQLDRHIHVLSVGGTGDILQHQPETADRISTDAIFRRACSVLLYSLEDQEQGEMSDFSYAPGWGLTGVFSFVMLQRLTEVRYLISQEAKGVNKGLTTRPVAQR